jgi:hypothetical protein
MKKPVLLPFLFAVFLVFGLFFFLSPIMAACDDFQCTSSTQCTVPEHCTCAEEPCSTTCQRDLLNPYGAKKCYVTEEPGNTHCPDGSWCVWGVCNYQDPFWLQTRFCCDPNIREYQIRQCTPEGDPPPGPGGGTACSVTLLPQKLYPGTSVNFLANTICQPTDSYVDHVDFSLSDATDFGICDSDDASCALGSANWTVDYHEGFDAKITASNNTKATSFIFAHAVANDGTDCTWDMQLVEIINEAAWCQARGGDMIAAGVGGGTGKISCTIPAKCVDPDCDPALITPTSLGTLTPGIVVAKGTVDDGPGGRSAPPLDENLTVTGNTFSAIPFASYDYDYFEKKASIAAPKSISANIGSYLDLTSADSKYGQYYWNKVSGDAQITGPIDIASNKIVLLVNGNLTINGSVHLDNGQGFFMAVVSGNINVSSSVKGPQESPPVPDLEGIYFANGTFYTGSAGVASDAQLHVRGSVVAGSFSLQRDLPNNSVTPGELFEYGPDQVMMFPSLLSRNQVIWREVAP